MSLSKFSIFDLQSEYLKGKMFLRLFKEGFLFAINSLTVNKLRTFLSLFGITIGIFCIISVFTVLDWLEKSIRDSIDSMGSNVIYVQKYPWSFDSNIEYWDIIRWPSVSVKDYQVLKEKSVKAAAISFIIGESKTIKYRNNIANDALVAAVTDDLEKVLAFEIDKGRYFSASEFPNASNVAVLGAEIAEKLFENQKVAIVPGIHFSEKAEKIVRFNIARPLPELTAGLEKLSDFLTK